MVIHNRDLALDKFFMHRHDHTFHHIQDLLDQPLDRGIYFRPSSSPIIDRDDYESGSCFRDYVIPTAAFVFDEYGSRWLIEKDLTLEQYRDHLYKNIAQRINRIYQKHQFVTLAYSGGADSTVLLSFIAKAGLLPRTDIICHENTTQTDPNCLHQNSHKIECINQILDSVRPLARSISWARLSMDEPVHFFNHGDLHHLKCYASAAMLERSPNDACIFGYHGNQVLLHKWIFWDDMIYQDPAARHHIQQFLDSHPSFYCDSLRRYDVTSPKISIDRRHHLQKPWALLDGFSGTRSYSPLADERDMQNLRRLDSRGIPIEMIADAQLARDFIDVNVGQDWNRWVTSESLADGDSLLAMTIPLDRLDSSLLQIPANLNHDPEGMRWLEYELDQARAIGAIPINSLVSIKNINWLASLDK